LDGCPSSYDQANIIPFAKALTGLEGVSTIHVGYDEMKPMVIRADFTYGSIEFHVAPVIFDTRYGEERGMVEEALKAVFQYIGGWCVQPDGFHSYKDVCRGGWGGCGRVKRLLPMGFWWKAVREQVGVDKLLGEVSEVSISTSVRGFLRVLRDMVVE